MVNTPKQFEKVPSLRYVTYCVDIVCLIFFVAEMVTKIKHMGLVGTEKVEQNTRIISFNTRFISERLRKRWKQLSKLISGLFSRSLVNVWWNNGILHIDIGVTSNIWVVWGIMWTIKWNSSFNATSSKTFDNDSIYSRSH